MRRKILAMFLAVIMAFSLLSLSACGGTGESPNSNDSESLADSESSQPSESFEPSESPEPVIPYAEANGLSFSKEKSYTLPAVTYLIDPSTGEPEFDRLSISDVVDASYTIGDISVSEADADGMVQMTIPYHIDLTTVITGDASIYGGEEFNYGWQYKLFGLFDYYTGIVIPTDGTLAGDAVLENSIDITYQDVTYPIAYTRSKTDNSDDSGWVNVGGNIYELEITASTYATYTIYMPQEYDGLCLSLYLPGRTEFLEVKEDSSEISYLLEAIEENGGDISDYVLIRVSDLM